MRTYNVTITYKTRTGKVKTKIIEGINAHSMPGARGVAKQQFAASRRRPNDGTMIIRSIAEEVGPQMPAVKSALEYRPARPDTSVGARFDMSGQTWVVRARFGARTGQVFCVIENLKMGGSDTSIKTLPESVLRDRLAPKITEEVVTLYPNGDVYQSQRPVQTSIYGVDNLIQVKVTKRNGVVIKKELV